MAGEKQIAGKLLKVYNRGNGKKEFENQQKAAKVVNKEDDVAIVPEPLFYQELELKDQSSIDFLTSHNIQVFDNKVEIILMNFVEGEDLATVLYKEVIKTHKALVHIKNQVDNLSFDEILDVVGQALKFKKPGGKSKDQSSYQFEDKKVASENASLLFNYLKETNFKLPIKVYEKVKKSLDLMHQVGIAHGDAHERNIMVGKGGNFNEVYLVDFDSLFEFEGEYDENVYEGKSNTGEKLLSDSNILHTLKQLNVSKEDEKEQECIEYKKELEHLEKRMDSRDDWNEFWDKLDEGEAYDSRTVYHAIEDTWPNMGEAQVRIFGAVVLELLEAGDTTKKDVINFLNEMIASEHIFGGHKE